MTDLLELLRETSVFGDLPDAELRRIAPALRGESYAKGEQVITEGERGDSAYLILSGEAAIVTTDLIGEQVVLRTFGAGAVFGEVALVDGAPRTATVRAMTDLEVYAL